MSKWMNLETGEVLSKEAMLKQFEEEHPNLDPWNGISIFDYYEEIEEDE